MPRDNSHLHPTIVDAASLYDAVDAIGASFGRAKVTIEYAKLHRRLDELRLGAGWLPASFATILLAVDPNSEGQQRFQTMLGRSGFELDVVHFRDAYVSVHPGRSPSEVFLKDVKPIASFATRIAYIGGLLAGRQDPQFLVVCHSFELAGPLVDLRKRIPNGKVGIAYFASLLDHRWRAAGLFDGKLDGIEFFDLEPHGRELMGIDLAPRAADGPDVRTGLSRF